VQLELELAEIRANEAKTDVNLNEIIAEIRTNNEKVQVLEIKCGPVKKGRRP
jgi:hypothetical protein